MKKIVKLFCVISCLLVCFTGCGKEKQGIKYEAEQMRAYVEVQIGHVGGIIEQEAVEEGYLTEDGVLKSAENSWAALKENCGEFVLSDSVLDCDIVETNGEITVTETLKFKKRNVIATSTFEEKDDTLTMTNLAFEPVYSLKEKLSEAVINTIIGMGTVFIVLIFMSFVIELFKFIPRITEAFEKRKNKKNDTSSDKEPVASETTVEEVVDTNSMDDTELIAVIAAAIAASENTTTDSFVVRSIRKR